MANHTYKHQSKCSLLLGERLPLCYKPSGHLGKETWLSGPLAMPFRHITIYYLKFDSFGLLQDVV